MKIHIPRYENGERWWDKNDAGYCIDSEQYATEIKSIDEFIDFVKNKIVIETLEECNELIEQINTLEKDNKNHLKIYVQKFKDIKLQFTLITKEMPSHVKEFYEEQFKPILEVFKQTIRLNKIFIIDNRQEIIDTLNILRHEYVSKMKEARARANKKYYEKRKEMMISVPKPKKTPEELKEAQARANKKYYEKRKALNDATKEEKTPEEVKLIRKETNRKYYQSKKELLEKIKLLEGVSSGANEAVVF